MAITNAQQYKQLVNPPLDGKRPGYRGDAAYRSASAQSTNIGQGNVGSQESFGGGQASDGSEGASGADFTKVGSGSTYKKNKEEAEKKKTIKEKIKEYNKNYKKKQLTRYQRNIINELNTKLGALGVDFYGDTEETYKDFIENYAPSITEFGPEGTGKYSQKFIDDVLSGKRKPPESFMPINVKDVKGGLLVKGLATGANLFGKKMAGPTTMEELMDLYSGDKGSYTRARDLDIDDVTSQEMMEEFEPNRFKLLNPEPGGDGPSQVMDPCKGPNPPAYCFVNQDPTDPTTPKRNLGGLAPMFTGSIYDFDGMANGGRAGMMDGGMMDDDPTGGIMDLETGRQMYFLGKLVKKAKRAVKKVVKSPLGKAALLGGAMYFGGGFGGGAGSGTGILSRLKTGLIGTLSGGEENIFKGGKFSGLANFLRDQYTSDGGKLKFGLGLGLGVPFALDLLGVGKDDDDKMDLDEYYRTQGINIADIRNRPYNFLSAANQGSLFAADGGLMRIGYQEGGDAEPVAKKTMPLIDMDGKEKDYRETGGFVDMGRMERADDVPARLSKNEFVFTADAVRNAGEGDIDKGAEVMYNMMKNLEAGGEVSEESQGLEGAREMFQTSQRLGEVI